MAFTNDSKHLVVSQKDCVSVYTLNGWEPMTINFEIPLNSADEPSLTTANNTVDHVAVYSDKSKSLVIF